jgi:hypothetical protein
MIKSAEKIRSWKLPKILQIYGNTNVSGTPSGTHGIFAIIKY